MKNLVPDEGGQNPSWTERFMNMFAGVRTGPGGSGPKAEPARILPPERRKAAMGTLDDAEYKWSLGALVLATVAGIAIPAYILATNKITKHGKNSIAVAPDAALLGGAIVLFCIIGFLALWKRKRTILTFDLFLVGLGFTPFIAVVGFIFIFLGAWLMLRAWRINRYGTTNAKLITREAREQPRGRDRKQQRTRTSKAPPRSGERKPPAASKRYTPKSPPRKKIPKPASKPTE
jgi:hypothetical protein